MEYAPPHRRDKKMKINFSELILHLGGNPVMTKEGDKDVELTLREVCVSSLLIEKQSDKPADGKEKFRRFRLADKIFGAKEPIAVPAEDVVLLKSLIPLLYGALIVGRAWDILERPEA
jgi:hypothetical protein